MNLKVSFKKTTTKNTLSQAIKLHTKKAGIEIWTRNPSACVLPAPTALPLWPQNKNKIQSLRVTVVHPSTLRSRFVQLFYLCPSTLLCKYVPITLIGIVRVEYFTWMVSTAHSGDDGLRHDIARSNVLMVITHTIAQRSHTTAGINGQTKVRQFTHGGPSY